MPREIFQIKGQTVNSCRLNVLLAMAYFSQCENADDLLNCQALVAEGVRLADGVFIEEQAKTKAAQDKIQEDIRLMRESLSAPYARQVAILILVEKVQELKEVLKQKKEDSPDYVEDVVRIRKDIERKEADIQSIKARQTTPAAIDALIREEIAQREAKIRNLGAQGQGILPATAVEKSKEILRDRALYCEKLATEVDIQFPRANDKPIMSQQDLRKKLSEDLSTSLLLSDTDDVCRYLREDYFLAQDSITDCLIPLNEMMFEPPTERETEAKIAEIVTQLLAEIKKVSRVGGQQAKKTQENPLTTLENTLTANIPGSFFVLSGGHFCGVHVFAKNSFAYFNGESGRCTVFNDVNELCDHLLKGQVALSLQAITYRRQEAQHKQIVQHMANSQPTVSALSATPPADDVTEERESIKKRIAFNTGILRQKADSLSRENPVLSQAIRTICAEIEKKLNTYDLTMKVAPLMKEIAGFIGPYKEMRSFAPVRELFADFVSALYTPHARLTLIPDVAEHDVSSSSSSSRASSSHLDQETEWRGSQKFEKLILKIEQIADTLVQEADTECFSIGKRKKSQAITDALERAKNYCNNLENKRKKITDENFLDYKQGDQLSIREAININRLLWKKETTRSLGFFNQLLENGEDQAPSSDKTPRFSRCF